MGINQGQLATGGTRWSRRKAAAFKGCTSRISREAYVRSCERLGVQFPGPTRRLMRIIWPAAQGATSDAAATLIHTLGYFTVTAAAALLI